MSLHFFPLYPDDFEADTAHLSLAEDGAYNRLLRLCWRTPGCSIPADRQWIYRRLRAVSQADRDVVDCVLDEFFQEENGRCSNARLTREFQAAKIAHERRKNAGEKGGAAKALKSNENRSSNATAGLEQCSSNHNHNHIIKTPSNDGVSARANRAPKRKPQTGIPDEFEAGCPLDCRAFAVQHIPEQEVGHEWSQFLDHHRKGDSRFSDWRAAWRTWARNAGRYRAGRTSGGQAPVGKRQAGDGLVGAAARRLASLKADKQGRVEPVDGALFVEAVARPMAT